jgi:hypothetical protein
MTAKWIFKGTGTKIYNASWHSQEFCPGKWWLSEYNVKEVVLEYLSLLLYATYHAALGR